MAIQLTPLHHNHNSMMHVFDSESSFRRNFHPPPGAGHPRMDEMAYKLPHPPSNLPLEGGGSYLPSLSKLCRNVKKPISRKRGEAVGWKRFRAVTFSRSDSGVPEV
jgi:hypothetical protein